MYDDQYQYGQGMQGGQPMSPSMFQPQMSQASPYWSQSHQMQQSQQQFPKQSKYSKYGLPVNPVYDASKSSTLSRYGAGGGDLSMPESAYQITPSVYSQMLSYPGGQVQQGM